jgi:hypothetical protein
MACDGTSPAGPSDDLLRTPSKRRRTRAGDTLQRLWQRTRWSTLSDDDEQQMEERRSVQAFIEKEVVETVQEAKQELTLEVAAMIRAAVQDEGVFDRGTMRSRLLGSPTASSSQEGLAPTGKAAAVWEARQPEVGMTEQNVQELIEEALRVQLVQIVEVFREGMAAVATKTEFEQREASFKDDLEVLRTRLSTLEVGAEAKKEGLRGRIDRLNTEVKEELGELRERLRDIETVVFEDDETDSMQEPKRKAADPDDLERHTER